MPAPPECLSPPFGIIGMFGRFGSLGRFGFLGRFGILGRILLLPEFARGTIGPEGVCEVYEGRGVEEKCFFAKRTHCKTSDIQLSNCSIRRYEICRRLGIGFVIGFVMLKRLQKGNRSHSTNLLVGGVSGAGGEKNVQGWRKWSTGLIGLCSLGGRQECLLYLNACRYLCTFTRMLQGEAGEVKKV